MKRIFHFSSTAIAVAFVTLLFSTGAQGQALQIDRLAILPLAAGAPPVDATRQVLDCREPELIVQALLAPAAADTVTACLEQALDKALPGKLVPHNERAGADELLAYMKKSATIKSHSLKLGEKVQASHVLAGTVSRYRERKGTAYGADKPAAVAFSVYLLDATTGDVLWSSTFDKMQQSLSENVLDAPAFFKHGAKWLTAQELSCRGAEDMAEKLQQFIAGKSRK